MLITMNDVLAYLQSDEPSYSDAAEHLGTDALPHLHQLAESDDADLPGKAAYLAGKIGSPDSAGVLRAAAQHADASVRVAAAAAVPLVPPSAADEVLQELVRDEDFGVRRVAVQSVLEQSAPEFLETLRAVANDDESAYIRELAGHAVERIERKPVERI